jgi:uncharacterized protein YcaQ
VLILVPERSVSLSVARRLALTCQRLAGPRPARSLEGIMEIMHNLGYIQIDPISIVAPSHFLVMWSRLGCYDQKCLDTLLWREKRLFEDWAQATSIVPTIDYPIFHALKRGYPEGNSAYAQKVRSWIEKNKQFRRYLLSEIRKRGPLGSRDLEDKAVVEWHSTGWTKGRNIDMMLMFLWAQGKIMVAGRKKGQKLYDLTERHLSKWVSNEILSGQELGRCVAQKSLRALGIGRAVHIKRHYIRGCCQNLPEVLAELESEDRIFRVKITDLPSQKQDPWYVHSEDLPLLDRLESGEWEPRTTLLSPFDNLICDRDRTRELFSFEFSLEIYVPKSKRKFGYYVMPILHGERLIGRVDPVMDRKSMQLTVNAVFVERDAPMSDDTARAVAAAMCELGSFLGAEEIVYGKRIPKSWRSVLC